MNSIRAVSTKISPANFARLADVMAVPFIGFCKTVNALGIRDWPAMNKREAALALMDIFGAPYAYYHSYDEVFGWHKAEGFGEVWPCNDGRRGFESADETARQRCLASPNSASSNPLALDRNQPTRK